MICRINTRGPRNIDDFYGLDSYAQASLRLSLFPEQAAHQDQDQDADAA